MHAKYADILEYFRESRLHDSVQQTLKEFQSFDSLYCSMHSLLFDLRDSPFSGKLEAEVLNELTD
jgi:hypothetical protein